MSEKLRPTRRPIWKEPPFVVGLVLTATVFWVFVLSLDSGQFCGQPDSCVSKWEYLKGARPNEIGDTLAGFAGTLAFVWLIVTVWLQAQELREQRDEFEKMANAQVDQVEAFARQRFESGFFEMFSAHSEIVASIDLRANGKVTTQGRDCFKVFSERLRKIYGRKNVYDASDPETIVEAYEQFWLENQQNLGHYFRFLFNFLRILDESPFCEQRHARLIRSQLSDYELLLIFYNCIHPLGHNFVQYAERFSLFDNLPTALLFKCSHEDLVTSACFDSDEIDWTSRNS